MNVLSFFYCNEACHAVGNSNVGLRDFGAVLRHKKVCAHSRADPRGCLPRE